MSGCSGVSVGGGGYLIRGPAPSQCYFPGGAWREATLSQAASDIPHSTGSTAGGNNQATLVWEWKLKPRDNKQLHRAVHRRTPLFKLPGLLSSKRIARVG